MKSPGKEQEWSHRLGQGDDCEHRPNLGHYQEDALKPLRPPPTCPARLNSQEAVPYTCILQMHTPEGHRQGRAGQGRASGFWCVQG